LWLEKQGGRVVLGKRRFSLLQVGACISGSRCFHPVGVGIIREICFLLVGAREILRVGALYKLQLVKEEVVASF
jgi:hypothetical protein